MPAHSYAIYDVFADTALAGNPLAVVFDAGDLETERMQAIAREFNLSETVFICPPEKPVHNASLRIFMPTGELPFAGHPTVGAAVAIAAALTRLAASTVELIAATTRLPRRGGRACSVRVIDCRPITVSLSRAPRSRSQCNAGVRESRCR